MKIWENVLKLSTIGSLLLTTLLIVPTFSSNSATIAAPNIIDQALTEGSTFFINITVADVTDMWGYEFFLGYNTSVLSATALASYAPFNMLWAKELDDAAGYVYMGYSKSLGQPGDNIIDPTPIARIDFTVDAIGSSVLDLYSTVISDSVGGEITHTAADGYFDNRPPPPQPPVASFTWMPATPTVGETVSFDATNSYDPDGTIIAWDWDFGDGKVGTGEIVEHVYSTPGTYLVNLTVTDNFDLTDSESKSILVEPLITRTLLSVASTTSEVMLAENFTIGVIITNVVDLYVFEFKLSYNTTVLDIVDLWVIWPDFRIVNETTGFLWVSATCPYPYPLSGNATLVAVTFNASGFGDSVLHLYDSTLINLDGIEFAHDTADGYISVGVTHDVAIVNVTVSGTDVYPTWLVPEIGINVTVSNEGDFTETLDVTVYYNITSTEWVAIDTLVVTDLAKGDSAILSFNWDFSGITPTLITTIKTEAVLIATVDDDPADNTSIDGTVHIKMPGDANGDGSVGILDAGSVSAHWYPGPPVGPLGYNPEADFNGDGKVDIVDAAILSANWS